MTNAEALSEARRRWGVNAWVHEFEPFFIREGDSDYQVGCGNIIYGMGNSREAAFTDADRRANGEQEKREHP